MKPRLFPVFFFLIFFCLAGSRVFALESSREPSLEEKIGQMIVVGFRGAGASDLGVQNVLDQIRRREIGGVLLLKWNITGKDQVGTLLRDLKKESKSPWPLLIAVDQEGGMVARLNQSNGFREFPSAKQIAASMSPEEAKDVYSDLAAMLKETGINVNLAPVVDLEINTESPAIAKKERSFSKDPGIVVRYAGSFIDAHRGQGLLTALKHFPGHGSARSDTHLEFTDVTDTWQEAEIEPYRELLRESRVDMVMTAHIFNRKLDDKLPASLSANSVQGLLRDKTGFGGVVITDDLQMGAISKTYGLEDTVIDAVNSGSDILLFANYFVDDRDVPRKAKEIILNAVRDGKIKAARIDESFMRIRDLKSRLP